MASQNVIRVNGPYGGHTFKMSHFRIVAVGLIDATLERLAYFVAIRGFMTFIILMDPSSDLDELIRASLYTPYTGNVGHFV